MNIRVPYAWLKNHLQTPVKAEELQKIVSLSGPSIERIERMHNEPVLDIEVTTNRMDSASIRGIAREAAVILSQAGKPSRCVDVPRFVPKTNEIVRDTKLFPIAIKNDYKLCSRVTAVLMDVKIEKSPPWMSAKLEQVGVRALNNLIDITNYVMMEIGQPTHVFDADRLGNVLTIREAKKGEKLTTLDGKTHTLAGGDIVADNGKGEIVDLIAIMGTANSVVTDATKRILFFIEHADPAKIRKTSMGLAIRTQAAQLNEKQLDPSLVMEAMLRGIHLFQELADAHIASPILDLYPHPVEPKTIQLPLEKVKQYLGMEIPVRTQTTMLERLGCTVAMRDNTLAVTVPTFRPDLEIPVDLIEEIARIYGYHHLPSALMATALPTNYPEDTDFSREYEVKTWLAALGWQEVYTYSAVSETLAQASGFSVKEHMKIQNPLVDEHVYLRRSLIPSHEEIISSNKHMPTLSIFELANTYTPRWHNIPEEQLHLTLTSTEGYRTVKGVVEAVLGKLNIPSHTITYVQKSDTSADIVVGKTRVGSMQVLSNGHTAVDMLWAVVLKTARRNPTYVPAPLFPPIIEDMTLTLPEKTPVGAVISAMQSVDKALSSIKVKDVYQRNVTFTIHYAFLDRQITTKDVEPLRKKLAVLVLKKFGAKVVGAV